MPYFDFHLHPGLKPGFADPTKAPTPWDFLKAKIKFKNAFGIEIAINALMNESLDSQSTLKLLAEGEIRMFGLALHSPESHMAKGMLEKKAVNKGKIELINGQQLKIIESGNHYYEFMLEELKRLTRAYPDAITGGHSFTLLQQPAAFNESSQHEIFGFLLVEGLHCFLGNQATLEKKEIFNRNFEDFTTRFKVLSINLCHIQQNDFCNHAFGIQFINPGLFYPVERGISNWGMEVVQRMMEKNILVDVKHMSLFSRRQFYAFMKNDDGTYKAPILCTHAGLTGQPLKDRASCLLEKPRDVGKVYQVIHGKPKSIHISSEDVYYNTSSINLYDEDIEHILLSGGLIGFSLDQRILGYANDAVMKDLVVPQDEEFISEQEAVEFFNGNVQFVQPSVRNDLWPPDDFENIDPSMTFLLHHLFLVNHVLHVLWVARNHEKIGIKKALNQLCFGSDFDGLINAIDSCKTVVQYAELKKLFLKDLPKYLNEAGLGNEGINVPDFVEKLFYLNGRNFVMGRLEILNT